MSRAQLQPTLTESPRSALAGGTPCCCLFRSARLPGRRRLARGRKKGMPVLPPPSRLRGWRGLVRGHQACAVCGNFIRALRSNDMIWHSIRALVRISVSPIARGREADREAEPEACRAMPGRRARRQVRVAGGGGHCPNPRQLGGSPRIGNRPARLRINRLVTKP
jgi:hypothetical protein